MENEQQPMLSIGDMQAAVKIIDAAVARGAIKGEEMVAVGTVRQRFVDFVENAMAAQGEPEEVVEEEQ
jgi:hypothetical protein